MFNEFVVVFRNGSDGAGGGNGSREGGGSNPCCSQVFNKPHFKLISQDK